MTFLSERAQPLLQETPPLPKAHYTAKQDLFHPTKNPKGFVHLGTAENEWLGESMAALLNQTYRPLSEYETHYDILYGSHSLRESLAQYFNQDLAIDTSSDEIFLAGGCSAILDMAAWALANPGDLAIVIAPFYPGFHHDLMAKSRVTPLYVDIDQSGLSQINISYLDQALRQAEAQQKHVRFLLFSSPANPTGKVYSAEEIKALLGWCEKNQIFFISDEIYANSVYNSKTQFVSALALATESQKQNLMIAYGFAKDFGLSGFKAGVGVCKNPSVARAMRELAYFSPLSTHTQFALQNLLADPQSLGKLIQDNKIRLMQTMLALETSLQKLDISLAPQPSAGVFMWADFSKAFQIQSFADEMLLWKNLFENFKLSISPGQIFGASRPGMFRICFARHESTLNEFVKRLSEAKQKLGRAT